MPCILYSDYTCSPPHPPAQQRPLGPGGRTAATRPSHRLAKNSLFILSFFVLVKILGPKKHINLFKCLGLSFNILDGETKKKR